MKKLVCLLLVLMLLPAMALAAVRMPQQRGCVTDDADVLSASTAADIASYAELAADEADITLCTVIVHFLDGMDAQTYANELFAKWGLGKDDMLLLVAAGEDSCATAMGSNVEKRLGRANAENLMYTSSSFSALVRTQQYDAAFASYYPALNGLMEKQLDVRISMDGLFGAAVQQQMPASFHSTLWGDVMNDIEDSSTLYFSHQKQEDEENEGLTLRGWIVLIILFVICTRKSKRKRLKKKITGCGCSPVVWLLRLVGLGFLIDKLIEFLDHD